MNLQRTGGDYRPQSMIIQQILDPVDYTNGKGAGKSQTFFARKEFSYANDDGVVEKQPLDIQATTFNPIVLQALSTLKQGDSVNLVGWLQPSWRGYVADDTTDGDRFAIPDGDRTASLTSPKGREIHPDAHPYRMAQNQPNVITYDVKQINVTELTLSNSVETTALESTQSGADPWATAQGNLNQATAQPQANETPQAAQPQAAQATTNVQPPFGG